MRRALVVALLTVAAASAGAQQEAAVQRGVVVQPESVTVGDPFKVVLRVRAPRGTVLEFPEAPDSGGAVEPLDRVSIAPGTDTMVVEQTATYRLAAWDVGRFALRFADIVARTDAGERRIPVGRDLAVTVVSVLPADSAQRIPKPVRPVYEFGVPWWLWLLVALAAALLGALFWWWWRRRPSKAATRPDPFEVAMRDFDHVESLGLVAAGETGHYLALAADVLRTYLSRVVAPAKVSLTTSELAAAIREESPVPAPRLVRALHDIDLVKFARQRVPDARARDLGAECRAIVVAVHEARQAEQAARAAQMEKAA